MPRYIYQEPDWPDFFWDKEALAELLTKTHYRHGLIMGSMRALGFTLQNETLLNTLTLEIIKSSEIEGEILDPAQVRSSIAHHLQLPLESYTKAANNVEGAVEVMLDATQHFSQPLTEQRLCHWQSALLRGDMRSIYAQIIVGAWRTDAFGPMQVVSGVGRTERVHYEAPPASTLVSEMNTFLTWVNTKDSLDPILKAAIAHLWFVTLHPFDDGNGRIARTITDALLARYEQSAQRFYSMSAQIRLERKEYYTILESTQKGNLDITRYLTWFLNCLNLAFEHTEQTIRLVISKAHFWEQHASISFNDRQKLMINKLFDGFTGKLTTTKWGKIAHCSPDTALRDIHALVEYGVLVKDPGGGRSTSYSLNVGKSLT